MRVDGTTVTSTVLFSDLVGSTELLAAIGEAAFDEFRRAHFTALRRALELHRGEEIKTLGDGILAVFGSAGDALHAAVAMQQSVHRQACGGSHPASIRVGLALGDVTFEDGDVFGTPVVEAARLVGAARPGQILAAAVVPLVAGDRGAVPGRDLGSLSLKGLPAPLPVSEVCWEPVVATTIPLPLFLGEGGRVFVGREAELEWLGRLWKQLAEPDAGVRIALLGGEPGVGKTRLAAEMASRVHAEGNLVLAGRCDEDLGVPFQPFVEALRHFVDHAPGHELPGALGRFPGELTRLVPELAERAPGLPPPLRADVETEQYRLFDGVAGWLAAASEERPVLLVLDDLQWAPKPTLLLLRHIQQSAGSGRLLILGTYRDTELAHDHALTAVLADLRRMEGVERCALIGLDQNGVADFLAKAGGEPLDDDGVRLAQAIHRETEGNPFFVREILRHLTEVGGLELRSGTWVVGRPLEQLGIPEGVRDVVGRRLARLPKEVNRALQTAAVLGAEFELAVLAAAGSFEADDLLDALEEAAAARLVLEVKGPTPRYQFGHALVRETLYDGIVAARRIAAHRRAASAIETIHAARIDDHLPALAHHWARAAVPGPDAAKALEYAARAGRRALEQLAHDEAARFFAQGLDVLDTFGDPDEAAVRTEFLIGLGEAQRRSGDPAFRETLLAAAHLAQGAGDVPALARAALANSRGFTWTSSGSVDRERVEVWEAALKAMPDEDGPVRARLLASLAMALVYDDDRVQRDKLSDEALAMARRVGDPDVLCAVLLGRFVTIWGPNTLAERRANTSETVEVAERLGDPGLRCWAYYRASVTAMEAGEVGEVEDYHRRIGELITDQLGQPALGWIYGLNRTIVHLLHGRIAEAERQAVAAVDLGRTAGQDDAGLWFEVHMFYIRREQGRLGEVEHQLVEAARQYPKLPVLPAMLALLYCETGRLDESADAFDRLGAQAFTDIPQDALWPGALALAAVVAHHLGDVPRSKLLYEQLSPYADYVVSSSHYYLGTMEHFLGLLARTAGRPADAEAHFAAAERTALRMQAPTWTARTRLEWAELLLDAGQQDRATGLLTEALVTARELGLVPIEQRAATLLRHRPDHSNDF